MIELKRYQWFRSHDYELVFDRVRIALSPEDLAGIVTQAWEHERPLTEEELETLLAQINRDDESA